MTAKPKLVLFAGVNGAGKSTLFQSKLWVDERGDEGMARVNPDEILRSHGWDWSRPADQIAAGKIAVRQIRELLASQTSFNQETTLTGRSIVRNVKTAAAAGYEIHVSYVGVSSPEIALARIEHRVETGGHDIDKTAVERRFTTSADNLVRIFPHCTTVKVFDNTHAMQLVAFADQYTIVDFQQNPAGVPWHKPILQRLQPFLRRE